MKRILVVGGGLIGIRHVDMVRAHPGCELVGLVDPDDRIATPAGVQRFRDMSEVKSSVDGAIIATPNRLHGEHGRYAASRGWHILVEKPVTDTLEDADALADAVDKAGVGSLVGHHRRYHAVVDQLIGSVRGGAIGTPVTASMIWAMRKPDDYFANNWRTSDGSPVMINTVHDIDLLRALFGEVTGIAALPGARTRGSTRIESGAVALGFDTGATATISFADNALTPWGFEAATGENPNIGTTRQDMLWITGTAGSVSFPSLTLWGGTADWGQPAQPTTVAPPPETVPLMAQLDHFLEVIDGATPKIDVASGRETLACALEIERQLTAAKGE